VNVTLEVTAVTPGDMTLTKGMDGSFARVVGAPAGCEIFSSHTAVPRARTARIAMMRIYFDRPAVSISAAAGWWSIVASAPSPGSGSACAALASLDTRSFEA